MSQWDAVPYSFATAATGVRLKLNNGEGLGAEERSLHETQPTDMLRKMEPMGTRAVLKSWSHLMYCGRILAMDSSNDTGQKLRGAARCSGKHHRTVAAENPLSFGLHAAARRPCCSRCGVVAQPFAITKLGELREIHVHPRHACRFRSRFNLLLHVKK
ncbi:hypothetical protein F444_03290 [Phytophthora nicotianae P1976]|uniref:Uncharacterized protein n=1 Tax=Phytophthora nicotianae P1976 TaxID=1317066 RepID=A0A081AUM8_PHYNI|nr:hypothetical protein F444_03290 [Phytophthora nicotianae P1976]